MNRFNLGITVACTLALGVFACGSGPESEVNGTTPAGDLAQKAAPNTEQERAPTSTTESATTVGLSTHADDEGNESQAAQNTATNEELDSIRCRSGFFYNGVVCVRGPGGRCRPGYFWNGVICRR